MQVILISKVPNLGEIGNIVSVKNGYAKNFLIPQNKAICFTENNKKIFEEKRSEFEKNNQDLFDKASHIKSKIENKDLVIIESASDDGRLYGSVNSSVIVNKINENIKQKFVSKSNIFLDKPIKEIGIYIVRVALHSDVTIDLRLVVTRSESEIESLLKSFYNSKKDNKSNEDNASSNSNANEEIATEGFDEKNSKKTFNKKTKSKTTK